MEDGEDAAGSASRAALLLDKLSVESFSSVANCPSLLLLAVLGVGVSADCLLMSHCCGRKLTIWPRLTPVRFCNQQRRIGFFSQQAEVFDQSTTSTYMNVSQGGGVSQQEDFGASNKLQWGNPSHGIHAGVKKGLERKGQKPVAVDETRRAWENLAP